MSRIAWITGAGGLIGNYAVSVAPLAAPGWKVIGLSRDTLDLTDFPAVAAAFDRDRPSLILHCAALSRSPACEADPALARLQNVEVTRRLCSLAKDLPLLFFSTDLVFDGREGNYSEEAVPHPLSVYAETKAAAERVVLENSRHFVLRTSLNGGVSPTADRGFNEQMRLGWRRGHPMKLFTDEFRSPIPAEFTARAAWEIALRGSPGIYHVAGRERLSRWQIGELLAARCPELNPQIQPGSLKEYQGAPRPPDTSLDCSKAQRILPFPLPGLAEWLTRNPNVPF